MPSSAERARRAAQATEYVYPDHLREDTDALPRMPGVYTFHGQDGLLPLYVGKSVNVRSRVMDHLRTVEEAALLRQARRVSCIAMAGDVGARLLEARLIKRQRPPYNRLLRKVPRQFSLRLYRGEVSVVHSAEYDLTATPLLFGLYSSVRSARESLRRIADEHPLCYALLGLERLAPGRPCFRAMIKRCACACSGGETLAEHEERLRTALTRLEIAAWPFFGRVALEEQGPDLRQFHVLEAWHYLGSTPTLGAARRLKASVGEFDRDAYRIIRTATASGAFEVTPLARGEGGRSQAGSCGGHRMAAPAACRRRDHARSAGRTDWSVDLSEGFIFFRICTFHLPITCSKNRPTR